MLQQTSHYNEPRITSILDVDTRWNSGHNMLGCALKIQNSLTQTSHYLANEFKSTCFYDEINEDDWSIAKSIFYF